MEFFNSAIEVLQTLVVALGAGLGVWGAINLLEGYGNDNPGSTPCVQLSPHTAFHRIQLHRACNTTYTLRSLNKKRFLINQRHFCHLTKLIQL